MDVGAGAGTGMGMGMGGMGTGTGTSTGTGTGMGMGMGMGMGGMGGMGYGVGMADGMQQMASHMGATSYAQQMGSPVVIASGLQSEHCSPFIDFIATLFGVFGDVMRVKILFHKRDTALVQFADAQQASAAVQFLNGFVLYGCPLKVNTSKNMQVNLPRKDNADASEEELTKDFSSLRIHRFRGSGSKNMK